MMLDINFIKKNTQKVKETVINKNLQDTVDVSKTVSTYDLYLGTLKLLESKRNLRNTITEDIKTILNSDQKDSQKKEQLIKEASQIKSEIKDLEIKLKSYKNDYENMLKLIPNVYSSDTPIGKTEEENKVIRKYKEPISFDFNIKDHIELGKDLDIIDLETASEVSGSRFFYLKNEAVSLQFAIINFVLSTLQNPNIIKEVAEKVGNTSHNTFTPIIPPVFVKPAVLDLMDRLNPIDDRYYFEKDNLLLVGSAEHTLGPMHTNQTLKSDLLPIRYIGYSTAFRRESGSYGKDVKGILRTHQFDKLEMESFSTAELGEKEQDLFVGLQEYMLQKLDIPYQVMQICTGDMGKPDYRQIDIECFIPSQHKYRETHTSDYMTDYQSRRLNTTYIDKDGNKQFVHMNDATAFAIGRILIAILENNQQEDGSIKVPEVLTKFTGFEKIVPKIK